MTDSKKTEHPKKLSGKGMRLFIALVLTTLLVSGACMWTVFLESQASYSCVLQARSNDPECIREFNELNADEAWLSWLPWPIVGVLAIPLLMWGVGRFERVLERFHRWDRFD